MTPYSGLLFFYILGLLLLPAILLGLWEKPLRHYGLLFTVVMLLCTFAESGQIGQLVLFYLWQMMLCFVFLHLKKRTRPLLWLAAALALLPLAGTKLGDIFPQLHFLSLLGVSYMTFRSMQVLLDIYDGAIQKMGFLDLSYFLLFFPSVSSGPIDRYRRFLGDLTRKLSREAYFQLLQRGVWKLLWGAFTCIVLSGLIWQRWLEPLPAQGFAATVSYMYGYTFFLFFNFSGFSDMVIGTACILGVSLPENFRTPFLSVDMKDFWARWHISLSTWLRDYIYTRFVMRSLRTKRFSNKRTASYLGYILTMMTMGVWHGLTVPYLIYGAYHGLLMCLNEALDLHWKAFRGLKQQGWPQVVCVVVTFHLFSFGLLIFSGRLFS